MRDRMCVALRSGCAKEGHAMFDQAASLLSQHLSSLFNDVSRECAEIVTALTKELEAQLSVLWERFSKADSERQKQLNAALAPQVGCCFLV